MSESIFFSENFGSPTANPLSLNSTPSFEYPQPSGKLSNPPPAVAIFGKCLPPAKAGGTHYVRCSKVTILLGDYHLNLKSFLFC